MNRDFSSWLDWSDESLRVITTIGATNLDDCASAAAWLARQTLEKFLKTTWIRLGEIPPIENDAEDMNKLALRFSNQLSSNDRELLFASIEHLEQFRATQYIQKKATPFEAQRAIRVAQKACELLKSWFEGRT
jgi:HEPN domain-containing protein